MIISLALRSVRVGDHVSSLPTPTTPIKQKKSMVPDIIFALEIRNGDYINVHCQARQASKAEMSVSTTRAGWVGVRF